MAYFNPEINTETGVATIWLDNPNDKVNIMSTSMMNEFNSVLDDMETNEAVSSMVFISSKKDSFIVGADIKEFTKFKTPEEAKEAIREAHTIINRLENSSKPVVAAIHGPCMGGGLEFALACHYRLATEHPKTVFALPEVKLGLLPGLGGTQRLPRTVGLEKGLDMILTGKNVYAKPAKKMGLIDATINEYGLVVAAQQAAAGLAAGTIKKRKRKLTMRERLFEQSPASNIVYQQAEKLVAKQTRGNYPAPAKIINCVRTGLQEGLPAGFATETNGFAELIFTPESKALRHLFFAQTAAKKNPLKDKVKPIKTIGMLGAGLMGSGIAQVSAAAGYNVLLKDMDLERASKGKAAVYKDVSKRVGRGMSAFKRDQIVESIVPTADYDSFDNVQLTIEAVLEDLKLKQLVLKDVEANAPEGHVFASNTSSIPITDIAEASANPESVVGMHYFSPVPKMPLIEIITTEKTADWALATAIEAGLKQGKTVIVVGDSPGFYTTRIVFTYMNEAAELLKEGARIEDIDTAMRDFGFPVGPIKLFDEVGIDVGAKINKVMADFVADRIELLDASPLVDAGYIGRKAKKGFYSYKNAKSKGPRPVDTGIYEFFGGSERKYFEHKDIQERISMAMINEAVMCLEEGVLKSAVDGDVGAVFGLGFPPQLGGPFFYLEEMGLGNAVELLARLEEEHGKRFGAANMLKEYANQEVSFLVKE